MANTTTTLPAWINHFNLKRIQARWPHEAALFTGDLADVVRTCRRLLERRDSRSWYVWRYTDDRASHHGAIPSLLEVLSEQTRLLT